MRCVSKWFTIDGRDGLGFLEKKAAVDLASVCAISIIAINHYDVREAAVWRYINRVDQCFLYGLIPPQIHRTTTHPKYSRAKV